MPRIIIIGMGLLGFVITGAFKRVPNQKIAKGQVASIEKVDMDSDGSSYIAIVHFIINNNDYFVRSKWQTGHPGFYVGQQLPVAYNEKNPQEALVRPKKSSYMVFIGLIIMGIIVAYLSFTGQLQ